MKKYLNLIPVVFLWFMCLDAAVEVFQTGINNSGGIDWLWPVGAAWLMTTLDIILFFVKKSWFRYAVIATLIIGILGIIRFTVIKTTFQINSSIELESTSILIAILFALINLKRILPSKTNSHVEITQTKENIEELKEKYVNRTSEELRSLIIDHRYKEEAKMAANEILKERENIPDF